MKIVFMGTPDFAVPSLEKLIEKFDVKAVLTQPDRPKGRGKNVAMSAVKEMALKHSIPVYQPLKIRNDVEMINTLKEIEPDFIIVVAFGQILTKEVLDIPKYACINLHGSLLPKYRGAAPLNFAVINGEKKSGNTTMLMDVGIDTGDMLLKQEINISEDMTAGELHDILMVDGAELLLDTINKFAKGEIVPQKQNDSESCYASMLNKEMAKINWNEGSSNIHNLIRGLNPWPIAYTVYEEKVMKIYKSKVLDEKSNKPCGEILKVCKDGIRVSTGDGVLLIEEVQFPGKKPLKVSEYIKGNEITVGLLLK